MSNLKSMPGQNVQAGHLSGLATIAPTNTDWQTVTWTDRKGVEHQILRVAPYVLLRLRAYASTAACNVRVLSRRHPDYPWAELVTSTEVAVAVPAALTGATGETADDTTVADTGLYDDQIHDHEILVQAAQATAGGSLTLSFACK